MSVSPHHADSDALEDARAATSAPEGDGDRLRDHTYDLFLQKGCIPGRELDAWREALTNLNAGKAEYRPALPAPNAQPVDA